MWALDIDEGIVDDNFQGRKWTVAVSTSTESRAAVKEDKEEVKQQKASEQDRKDDAALLKALDKLDEDGSGRGYNRIQVESRLSDARMARAVTRLKDEKIVKELKVKEA